MRAKSPPTSEAPIQTPKQGPVAALQPRRRRRHDRRGRRPGHGHTATIEGAEWPTDGRYGEALEFNGDERRHLHPRLPRTALERRIHASRAGCRPEGVRNRPVIYKEAARRLPGLQTGDRLHHRRASPKASLAPKAKPTQELRLDGEYAEDACVWHTSPSPSTARSCASTSTANWSPPERSKNRTAAAPGPLKIGCSKLIEAYFKRSDRRGADLQPGAGRPEKSAADIEAPIQTPRTRPGGRLSTASMKEGATTVEDVTGDGHTATIEGAEWAPG